MFTHTDKDISTDLQQVATDAMQHFVGCIKQRLPKEAMETLEAFIEAFGKSSFLDHYQQTYLASSLTNRDDTINIQKCSSPILARLAIDTAWLPLLEKLISLGIDANAQVLTDDNTPYTSALALAILNENQQAVALLATKADLLARHEKNLSSLMLANTVSMLGLLINAATKRDCLHALLKQKTTENNCAFRYHTDNNNPAIVNTLMMLDNWVDYTDLRYFLMSARKASWEYSDQFESWDAICLQIREKLPKNTIKPFTVTIQKDLRRVSLSAAYKILFNQDYSLPTDKQQAIQRALAQIYSLLSDPRRCFHFLQRLNDEFECAWRNTPHGSAFSPPNPSHYTFKSINDLYYPIPSEQFVGNHKHNALDTFLISLFKKHGLSDKTAEWIGHIPHDVADLMVTNGMHIKENRYGVALMHGTIAHSLQQAIFIYAIQAGEVNLTYHNGQTNTDLLLTDVLKAFVEIKRYNDTDNIWMTIRDARYFDAIRFSDPHRLTSILMQEGRQFGCKLLSDYLIDSFCKSYQRLLKAHNEVIHPVTAEVFLEQLNDLQIHKFPVPQKLREYAIYQKDKSKKTFKLTVNNSNTHALYAVAEKDYAAIPLYTQNPSLFFTQAPQTRENGVKCQQLIGAKGANRID